MNLRHGVGLIDLSELSEQHGACPHVNTELCNVACNPQGLLVAIEERKVSRQSKVARETRKVMNIVFGGITKPLNGFESLVVWLFGSSKFTRLQPAWGVVAF